MRVETWTSATLEGDDMSGSAPPEWMKVADEIREAVSNGSPVVALESTVLAQGMPYPRNLEVGVQLETIVRSGGGVPATVAVVDGIATVGLSRDELTRVTTDPAFEKRSTRDLPVAVSRKASGATTVSATAFLAHRAGIRTFATGGIGGVHRGLPPDVSSDLTELRQTPILVVCAGAKTILDLPATREVLETFGILVLGWKTESFPAFYLRDSGLTVDARVEGGADVAAIWRSHRALGLSGAILLCAPVPEERAMQPETIEDAIGSAIRQAEEEGIRGKEITPHLMRGVVAATGGAALEANVALLTNNAAIATEAALALAIE
jgi:pseudouridylate synthase